MFRAGKAAREGREPQERGRILRRVFRFVVQDARGRLFEGKAGAGSEEEVRGRLAKRGLTVIELGLGEFAPRETRLRLDETPPPGAIPRVAELILMQAMRDNASRIRMVCQPPDLPKGLEVSYTIRGEEQDIMTIPFYLWPPLRERFAELAGVKFEPGAPPQSGVVHFEFEGKSHELNAAIGEDEIEIVVPEPQP